jgi:hypothetical protein
MVEPVAAALTLEHQAEGRIAGDVEAGDVVHLEGDIEGHGRTLFFSPALSAAGGLSASPAYPRRGVARADGLR